MAAYLVVEGLKYIGGEEVVVHLNEESIIERPTGDWYTRCLDLDISKLPEGVTKLRVVGSRN